MNNSQTNKRSRVIPKWLEYPKAIKKGELVVQRRTPFVVNKATKKCIQIDLDEFKANQTPEMACRLMGAGIVIGDNQLARDMAVFLVKKGGWVDSLSIKLADKILNIGSDIEQVSEADVRISHLRKWISEYPNSAIAWIELSRAFTIKGQDEKAKRAAKIALQLAPYDRYIVRCAVRLFLHTSDFDIAWHYIKRASKHHFDPWIKATEVNVALISEHNTPDIKKFILQNLSGDQLFHYSELFESAGYLELNSGNDRKAKKHLRLAWTKPSDNVITHAEWLLRNKIPWMRESTVLEFDRSLEAKTWINYVDLKLDKAIEAAREWELEEPYSKYPFVVGSSIACDAGNPELGAEIAKRGLQVNPHDRTLYNNLCYTLLRAGKVEEAGKYINKLKVKKGMDSDLFCQATIGLYEFKNKNIIVGRQAYLDVIDQFKQNGQYELLGKAFLNLSLAELDVLTAEAKITAIKSLEATESMQSPDIILLRNLVQNRLDLLNK
jgi:tetratricopeptide (TPR) repeat protein